MKEPCPNPECEDGLVVVYADEDREVEEDCPVCEGDGFVYTDTQEERDTIQQRMELLNIF